jgi:hypothetical protein
MDRIYGLAAPDLGPARVGDQRLTPDVESFELVYGTKGGPLVVVGTHLQPAGERPRSPYDRASWALIKLVRRTDPLMDAAEAAARTEALLAREFELSTATLEFDELLFECVVLSDDDRWAAAAPLGDVTITIAAHGVTAAEIALASRDAQSGNAS